MKPRKWVLVVALIFLALISAYQYGLYRLSKNRNLENLLIEQVGAVVGGEFDVDNIKIGFFSTTLSGLKISIPFGQTAIDVDKIRIGFSFAQYLISGGDITSSLSSIVLVDPVINVRIPEGQEDVSSKGANIGQNIKPAYEMPVKSILLRNGSIHLISRWKQRVVSVDKLNGKLVEVDEGIEFELKGRLASTGKNLTFNGSLLKEDGTLRLSSRLSKARITKKIQFRDLSIYKGTLDGVVEFTFSDAPFPNNISANGHVTISSGRGSIEGFDERLNNLNVSMSFEENMLNLGKMSFNILGMDFFLSGKTGYSLLQNSYFNIDVKNISSKHLQKTFDVNFEGLTGLGSANISIRKPKGKKEFNASANIDGFKYQEDRIEKISLESAISAGDLILKKGVIKTEKIELHTKGTLNYMKTPYVYSFSSTLKGSNNFLHEKIGGSFSSEGIIRGIGNKFDINLTAQASDIVFDSLNFGDLKLLLKYDGQKLEFNSLDFDGQLLSINGYIDSLSTKKPLILLNSTIHSTPFLRLFKDKGPAFLGNVNTFSSNITVSGRIEEPVIKSDIDIFGKNFGGRVAVDIQKSKDKWTWILNSDSMKISDEMFPIYGTGVYSNNRIRLKELSVIDKIKINGDVSVDSSQSIDLRMTWDSLSLTKIDKLFLEGDSLIYSGILRGSIRVQESLKDPRVLASFGLRNGIFAQMDSISTDFVLTYLQDQLTVLPFLLRKNGDIIASVDTLNFGKRLSLKGEFNSIDIKHFVKEADLQEMEIDGKITGSFETQNGTLPVYLNFKSDSLKVSNWSFSEINAEAEIFQDSIKVVNISAKDDKNVHFKVSSLIPIPFLSNEETETDTLLVKAIINGDLLGTIGTHVDNPVGGKGNGECKIEFFVADDEVVFTQAYIEIDSGYMTVYPFVPDTVKNISLFVNVNEKSELSLDFKGTVNKEPVNIYTTHDIPDGLEPFELGLLNAGVVEVTTGEKGIPLFLPGFLEKKNLADIEFQSKDSLRAFTLSGPIDKFRLTGTWVIRNAEFTFPFVDEEPPPENDPFPFVTWDLDLRIGNRNVTYFYNVGGKKRRVMRFVECSLDPPTTKMGVRGRDKDGTFRLIGNIRSYRGSVFYGKVFDRNFELGCNFVPIKNKDSHGYNNLPIIWGSVEAFSDTSRFDRITLKLLTKDPVTGSMSDRGRFNEITFRLSSNFEEVPGESEREFFREAGLNIVTLKGAGGYVSGFGDSYVNKYLLGRIERKIARKLGLDVISVETSVASNYFNYLADSSFGGFSDQLYYLTFANVGVTIGRYFLRDRIFLKWRTELMPIDLSLVPEHSIGFEYQPVKYLWFDFNYGFHKEGGEIHYDPKVMMQLRMPLDRIKKAFNGNK